MSLTERQRKAMRKKIALDVLKQLKSRKLISRNLSYCLPKKEICLSYRDMNAQQVFNEVFDGCRACAMGSLLLSNVRLNNKLLVRDLYPLCQPEIHYFLSDYFDIKTLLCIEAFFEGSIVETIYSMDEAEKIKIVEIGEYSSQFRFFFKKSRTPTKRLRLIMQNIVDGKGDFCGRRLCAQFLKAKKPVRTVKV